MDKVGKYTLEIMNEASWYNNWLFALIKPHLAGDILEIGAGIGNFTELLTENITDPNVIYATDKSREYVSELTKKYKDKAKIAVGDIEANNNFFNGKKFDAIICLNVLEHIKEDDEALKNMFTLLKKHGKLILLVPAHKILFSDFDKLLGHWRRYDKKLLGRKLSSVGLKRVLLRYINFSSAFGWLIFLKFTKWREIPKKQLGIFDFFGKIFLWPENFIEPPFGLSVLAIYEK